MEEKLTKISIEELHKLLLNMLIYFDEVCNENGITYFLSGGTALGAIRERGFIPWDDDIDIMMPRNDYEKLVTVLSQRINTRYSFYSLKDPKWDRPYACIIDNYTTGTHTYMSYSQIGVTMDILPIDGVQDSIEDTIKYYKKLRRKYTLYYAAIKKSYMSHEKHIAVKKVVEFVSKIIGAHAICKNIDQNAKKISFETSTYVGCTVLCHYMEKERFDRQWFTGQEYVDFESGQFPVMNGYDLYLHQLYGNYMKRPEKQVDPDHSTEYYWRSKI